MIIFILIFSSSKTRFLHLECATNNIRISKEQYVVIFQNRNFELIKLSILKHDLCSFCELKSIIFKQLIVKSEHECSLKQLRFKLVTCFRCVCAIKIGHIQFLSAKFTVFISYIVCRSFVRIRYVLITLISFMENFG